MPISKHHTKKGSHAQWRKRAFIFKEAQRLAMASTGLTRSPNHFFKSLSWGKGKNDDTKTSSLFNKLKNLFRGGNRG